MRRPGTAALALLVPALLHVHIHIHQRLHGPPFDYVGLAAASFASWVGLPGPGEPVLLAAGILAAKHKLDLGEVLVVAFLGAVSGGIVGWAIGLKAGRALATAPGPLRELRIRTVERGEEIFARYPVWAIIMAPAFVSGIHRVRTSTYQIVNIVSAVVWTVVIGVGGYFVGPPVLDAVEDLGTGFSIVVAGVLVCIIVFESSRRLLRGRR